MGLLTDNKILTSLWSEELNGAIPSSLSERDSNASYWWICHRGHSVMRSPNSMLLRGCIHCRNLEREGSLGEANPRVYSLWSEENNVAHDPGAISRRSREMVRLRCLHCEWEASREARKCVSLKGCPHCSRSDLLPSHLQSFYDEERSGIPWGEVNPGSKRKLWWRCLEHGHSFPLRPGLYLEQPHCRVCAEKNLLPVENSLADVSPASVELWDERRNTGSPGGYKAGSNKVMRWRCGIGHSWEESIVHQGKQGNCPYCSGRRILLGFNDAATLHPHLLEFYSPDNEKPLGECNSRDKPWWRCAEGHVFIRALPTILEGGVNCPRCKPRGSSLLEKEVVGWMRAQFSPGITLVENDRSILGGRELDIYLPEMKLAVEVNGDYWHSRERIQATHGIPPEQYHGSKRADADKRGVALAFLWQGDWVERREEMENALQEFLSTGIVPDSLSKLVAPGERGEE